MADQIKVTQVQAQVEGQNSPLIKTTQVIAQVEGQAAPLIKATQVLAQVEYEAGVRLWPSGIPSAETFGSPELQLSGAQTIQPGGIPSSEALGSAAVSILPGNRFILDPHCKAVWRFENNLLDYLGGNLLTSYGDPGIAFDGADKKEGQYCGDFEWDNLNYAARTDADLSAGFPLKSGDANKKISLCFWSNPETLWMEETEEHKIQSRLVGKWSHGAFSFLVILRKNKLKIFWGYDGGVSSKGFATSIIIPQGEWSHIGVVLDGVAKTIYVRVYRVSNDTIYEYAQTAPAELSVTTAPWQVAGRVSPGAIAGYDGRLDELAIFDDLLTPAEIDAIRQGTYYTAILPPSIVSEEEVGQPAVTKTNVANILPAGIGSQEALGVPTLQSQSAIQPVSIPSQEAFGSAQISLLLQQIFPGAIPSAEAWGQAQVQPGAITIQPSSIVSQEAFGLPAILPGTVLVRPEGIASPEVVGQPTLIPGPVAIHSPGIVSGEAFGQPRLMMTVKPVAIPSAEEFGAPTLLPGVVQVLPAGISSQEALGGPAVIPGMVTLRPEGIGYGEKVGEPLLGHRIRGIGLDSGEAFGTPTILPGLATVAPAGINSGEALGRVRVKASLQLADLIVLEVEGLLPVEMTASLPDCDLSPAALEVLEFTDGLAAADLYTSELKAVANG